MRYNFWRKRIYSYFSVILFAHCCTSTQSNNQFIKVCRGTNYKSTVTGLSPLDESAYTGLKLQFSNCTHVIGNLELINIPEGNTDLSFLEDIRQVTGYINIQNVSVPKLVLPNLEVIRGKDLMKNDLESEEFALVLKPVNFLLGLPKLKAILNGEYPENYKLVKNFTCSSDCNNRCFGPGKEECCHANCAGGCTGPSNEECIACKHSFADGFCEDKCPPLSYSAYGICIKLCPADLFRDDDLMECVIQCPDDKDDKGNVCVPCTPPSCKICLGASKPDDYINKGNIESFRNCTVLLGSLRLNEFTFKRLDNQRPVFVKDLDFLKSIRKIRGSLQIDSFQEISRIGFLDNLEEIGEGLSITRTKIKALNFRSLKRVTGGIEISRNPDLCFVADINWSKIRTDRSVIKVELNDSPISCLLYGEYCDDACQISDGCWGWGRENCISCKKYRRDGKCQKSCKFAGMFNDEETDSCFWCHEKCYRCVGPGPDNCTSCTSKTIANGASCIETDKCQENKFQFEKWCLNCHTNCSGGCTGPRYLDCLTTEPTTKSELEPTTSLATPESESTSLLATPKSSLPASTPSYIVEIATGALATIFSIILGIACYYLLKRRRISHTDSGEHDANCNPEENIIEDNNTAEIEMRSLISQEEVVHNEGRNVEDNIFEANEVEPIVSSSVTRPHLNKINKIDAAELTRGRELSSGHFGVVYEGIWTPKGGSLYAVAIKMLRFPTIKEFLHEASIMFLVDHPNLLGFWGVCEEPSAQLVTPLLMGSLLDYVKREKGNIEAKVILDWCTQIASGMAHLESLSIIHRDLALRNVLVETPTVVKITDFGLSRFLDKNNPQYKAQHVTPPWNWLAIESILEDVYTHKSDVWQFGVTVWELLMFGERPFRGNENDEIRDFLLIGNRLQQPEICKDELYNKLLETWRFEPIARPAFTELVRDFGEMTNNPDNFIDMGPQRRNVEMLELIAVELERAAVVGVANY